MDKLSSLFEEIENEIMIVSEIDVYASDDLSSLFEEIENEIMLVSEIDVYASDDQDVADDTIEELQKSCKHLILIVKKIREKCEAITGQRLFPIQKKPRKQ